MKSSETRPNRERLLVIENIAKALQRGDSFAKVELHDPIPTEADVKKRIIPFDTLCRRPQNKLKRLVALAIARFATKRINEKTEIVGLENALSVEGGVIITCNHFNPVDNTVVRFMTEKWGREKRLSIIVQESNILMKGFFGFLMRNSKTLPVSSSAHYMAKNLKPALEKLLSEGEAVLIYPEQEMWFNYKKPRELRDGAYHMAYENNVPILPCFIEMQATDRVGKDGFFEVKHIMHIMPPIYPDQSRPRKEERERMKNEDARLKRECYESAYGIPLDDEFIPERDIAGYRK